MVLLGLDCRNAVGRDCSVRSRSLSRPFAPILAVLLIAAPPALAPGEPSEQQAPLRIHRTTHFAIEHDASDAWAADLGRHLEALALQFNDQIARLGVTARFEPGAAAHLGWLCVTAGAWDNPEAMTHLRADYDTRLHRVQLLVLGGRESDPDTDHNSGFEPDGQTTEDRSKRILFIRVSHEVAHQLAFECGLQKRGVMYPLWLVEGFATNFESPGEELAFLGENPARRSRLKALADKRSLMTLPQLARITSTRGMSSRERVDLYAQAWGLFRFLAAERAPELAAYMKYLADLPCGRRSRYELRSEMCRAFGSLDELEQAWTAWVARL